MKHITLSLLALSAPIMASEISCYEHVETTTITSGNFEVNMRDYTIASICQINPDMYLLEEEKETAIQDCEEKLRREEATSGIADSLFKNRTQIITLNNTVHSSLGSKNKWVPTKNIFHKLYLREANEETLNLVLNSTRPEMARFAQIQGKKYVFGLLSKQPWQYLEFYKSMTNDLSNLSFSGYHPEVTSIAASTDPYLEQKIHFPTVQLMINHSGKTPVVTVNEYSYSSELSPKLEKQIQFPVGEEHQIKIEREFMDGRVKVNTVYSVGCKK